MIRPGKIRYALVLALTLGVSSNIVASHRRGRSKSTKLKAAAAAKANQPEDTSTDSPADNRVRLQLVDGTSLVVDDAHETAQGVWYQRGGVTYLMTRDRVKTVEKGRTKSTVPSDEAVSLPTNPSQNASAQPVWIYLVGGARVEADNATESTAGVWYKRGLLNIFIERSRVERIEREVLESTAKSDSSIKERGWTSGNGKIDSLIKQNGAKHGVDPYLIFCVMEQESHFSARAVSPKGARGLMQLMPGTGARFGVRNPFSPGENIAAGTRYLKQLMNRFNGRVDLVLASYNAGEGAVVRFGHRVPPYRETRDYVRRISYRYHRANTPIAHHKGSKTPALGN